MVKLLRNILGTKDHVSYSGSFYRLKDAKTLLADVIAYAEWAEERYKERVR
jgi:hypothetical protein